LLAAGATPQTPLRELQNAPQNRNSLRGGAKMGGDFGKKVGLGKDDPELDPP